ncbi:MAG: hypothetical protein OEW52_08000 [Thermoleophilia bacterium]|nr:hypothetical protein [Thermoleophilia bacterium]MDH4341140.1 hypothetical protein [Thermoleophilia bacterium]MDH5281077.1 hypothetical protein [Thermoleophilia bacterium]
MSGHQRRLVAGTALGLVAVLGAFVVLVLWSRGDSGSDRGGLEGETAAASQAPIVATGTLSPRVVLFGDTLTGTVDVVVDRAVIEPAQVKVAWNAAPWSTVRPPERLLEVAGSTAYLRTTFVLRCLSSLCVPPRETEKVDFDPALVTYVDPADDETTQREIGVPLPQLVVHTRIGELEPSQRDALSAPWRADLVSLPLVSYRVAPGLAAGIFAALGALLVALAGLIVYRAWPRRQPKPEPPLPPAPVATPLEQALALLESPAAANGAEECRRALELVADEVEHLGDLELALTARELAWSEDSPDGEETTAVAILVRTRIESVNRVSGNGSGSREPT